MFRIVSKIINDTYIFYIIIIIMKTLTKLSFTISILGIFILLLLSNLLEPKLIKISEISIKDLDKNVKIEGKIKNIRNYEQFTILTISDTTDKIDILINKNKFNTVKNQTLTIIGTVNLYKDILQIKVVKIF